LKPQLPNLHYDFGTVLDRLGRYEEALEQFQAAVEADPRDAESWVMLGDSFMRSGRLPAAIARYQEAVQIRPDAPAHNSLGFAYLRAGRLDNAIAEFREALRLRPDDPQAQANLETALATRR
jgi:Flp pilus assembly protein TadD